MTSSIYERPADDKSVTFEDAITSSQPDPARSAEIKEAISLNQIDVRFNTSLKSIEEDHVKIMDLLCNEVTELENELVYIFAGGELPTQFLEKAGIQITRKFGEALLKH